MAKNSGSEAEGLQTVDFDLVKGAKCPNPECGKRTKVKNTLPWEEGTRIRYHECVCGLKVRSIQELPSSTGGFRSDQNHPLAR